MIKFEKYHGLGNDFIIFNYRDLMNSNIKEDEFQCLAKKICNRHTGIGADGIMIFVPKKDSAQMIFINSDGSIGEMCGNGIRCFSNYIYNNKLLEGNKYIIETLAGIMTLDIYPSTEFNVKVNMGKPTFKPHSIPVNSNLDKFIEETIKINNQKITLSTILLGVPHTVIFVEDIKKIDLVNLGKQIENHDLFPEKTNVNFVEIVNEKEIIVDTWERGAGHTLACGTGSCASVIVGNHLKKLASKVKVRLQLGDLEVEVKDDIFMTGPAKLVAKGKFLYK